MGEEERGKDFGRVQEEKRMSGSRSERGVECCKLVGPALPAAEKLLSLGRRPLRNGMKWA